MIDQGRGGFVHPPGDLDGMVASVRALVANPTLCRLMGEHNQRKVDWEYRATGVLQQLFALYEDLRRRR